MSQLRKRPRASGWGRCGFSDPDNVSNRESGQLSPLLSAMRRLSSLESVICGRPTCKSFVIRASEGGGVAWTFLPDWEKGAQE